ncbi:response regulator transcription factor [Hydrogenophaga sp. 2FB]|uniref:LuxR C-terminal-related transcriptional regulator n=1 Tax=Hydrogenophaga sp. 2FB TaxID=2502187 RepID=UPI00207BA001|nr:response regulator transcription factor [Hydrogenophaga sp. 2FB]
MLLSANGDFKLVGETALGSEVEALVRLHRPDLLLLDLALGDSSGIEVARKVKRAVPPTRILVVTGNVYPGSVTNAFAAGADGFVLKHEQGDELLDAIRAVLSGRRYVSPQVAKAMGSSANRSTEGSETSQMLTPREQQIVRLIAKGGSNQEIADALHISVLTARKHRQNVMIKLGLHNGAEIAAYAIKSGLAEAPDVDGNL